MDIMYIYIYNTDIKINTLSQGGLVKASRRSRFGVGMNRSARGGTKCKAL